MKRFLILTSALVAVAATAQAQDRQVDLLSWGGAYGKSHVEAYAKPFEAETGIKVTVSDADNPATPVKAQVEAGNVTVDVASVEYADAVRLCDEGLLEEIDPAILLPAEDGTAATDDFIAGAVTECFVGTDVYSMVLAYDDSKFADAKPAGPADFFDTAKFPGKRTMRKGAKFNLEFALMADGVAPDQVYDMLGTPEGVDRAFAKLETIKDDVIWWEAGAQPPQLLADGEVSMAFAFNGRIFNAAQGEGKPFKIVWDGQIYEMEGWVIPKGAPHLDEAKEFVAFSTAPKQQARAAEFISYGPPRVSAAALVGNIEGTDVPMGPNLPTFAENMTQALGSNLDFWVDHDAELQERFNAWLAAN
ncbi:putative spermidine/putrescine transport system substrate-binding protein [Paracoccus halophilus]|uniref:Putative spermidine/putrescine transport system substrate-binding protein n=1 Tax=Paracoccus halophilus TaxID=376733 RepID=A0A099F739_9RHOB|nr:ABC transporter substrate-binding protein [Paracoccus halophilus]KGJ05927.1 spermidine/putrescine ABC transporter substrate-binding protein [Paracoccus halophilus]SFA53677.1 putative spermidine/putrescine transport system substrate-binding protein [Paracoccus halophilus]